MRGGRRALRQAQGEEIISGRAVILILSLSKHARFARDLSPRPLRILSVLCVKSFGA